MVTSCKQSESLAGRQFHLVADEFLTFRGVTCQTQKNDKGLDLYRDGQLAYKLIVPKGDELWNMACKSPYRRNQLVKKLKLKPVT